MPEVQATRRTPAARRKQQRENAPLGPRRPSTAYGDASTIEDRILKWQTQDVAQAVDPDILSVRSLPRSERSRTPVRAKSPLSSTPDEPQSTSRRKSTKWVQQENAWVRQRRSTREQRRSPGTVRTPVAESNDRSRTVERSSPVVDPYIKDATPPVEYTRNESLRTRNVKSSHAERELRRRRRREARAKADNGRALVEDGIRVYARSESHPASERLEQDTLPARSVVSTGPRSINEDFHEPSVEDLRSKRPDSPKTVNEGFVHEDNHDEVHDEDLRQPSKYAQTLGRAPVPLETIEQPKTRTRTIFNKTREILVGRNDVPLPISNRIPSIEAWLEEQPIMPDPFVDHKEDDSAQSIGGTKFPKHRSHRKKIPSEPTIAEVDDPNKIWESVESTAHLESSKSSPRRKLEDTSSPRDETASSKRRLFSFEVCNEPSKGEECPTQPPLQEVEPQSPVTLKRRGARTVKNAKTSQSATLHYEKRVSPQYESPTSAPIVQNTPIATRPLPRAPVEPTVSPSRHAEADVTKLERLPSTGLKRKLTTHEDLLSVLSQPRARRSTRSTRSLRQAQRPSSEDILRQAIRVMKQEEAQYTRELRTLVDGVTPVLLQSLLSKNDSTATTGLFTDTQSSDANLTRPIVQMGGALQRLKNLHGRIPLHDHDIEDLLLWAGTAHKAYSEYVRAWRLGFHGIIVNLAPLDGSQKLDEDMLSRDIDGDITNEQGEKVDVAFLQKRPLIRIKKLSKLFATIRDVQPANERAALTAEKYADLTETAKQRHSEEQGRLEDEAAANTDATRARDIKTMGVPEPIFIDRQRKVRARDYFDMTLQHSNGQRIDCKIEIILRDDPHLEGAGGDVLICQVEETSKWLLFAPVDLSHVSVRRDQSSQDLVLMVRGVAGIGREWHELLALRAEEEEAVTEWLHMLGSKPLPPKLKCVPSWQQMSEQPELPSNPSPVPAPPIASIPLSRSALASIQSDVDIPIGEPSVILTRRKKKDTTPDAKRVEPADSRVPTKLSLGGGLQTKNASNGYRDVMSAARQPNPVSIRTPERSSPVSMTRKFEIVPPIAPRHPEQLPQVKGARAQPVQEPLIPRPRYSPQKIVYEPSDVSGATSASQDSYFTDREARPYADAETPYETRRLIEEITHLEQSWAGEPLMSGGLGPATPDEQPRRKEMVHDNVQQRSDVSRPPVVAPERPKHSRAKSSSTTPLSETIREQWASISGFRKKHQSTPNTPVKRNVATDHAFRYEQELVSGQEVEPQHNAPLTPRPDSRHKSVPEPSTLAEARPAPPPHEKSTYTISSSPRNSTVSLPDSIKQELPYYPESASPLKHQYQPSSSSSGTESDGDETDATSDISDDVGSEIKDWVPSLVNVGQGNRRAFSTVPTQKPTVSSTGTRTLDPSDSASNGPYRQALPASAYPADKKKRTIAMVCSWSDKGIWEPIRDDECSIVISPGLVQAFMMTAAHSQPLDGTEWDEGQGPLDPLQKPLVEFELTPVVPLRKGTALDITIRSPPTANSTVVTTNNVMFRSRTVQECERLYQYINWARCHNPIFAQLARDRPRQETVTFAANVQQTKSRSWFSFGSREKTSYRASSRPPASMPDTMASGSSGTSAFSALRKFGKNSPFSLKRSSVVRQPDMTAASSSLYSASNGTGPSSASSTPAPSQAGYVPGPDGPNVPQTSAEAANGGGMVNNMKIRLFFRQGQKWEAVGQCLLTVLPAATAQELSAEGAVPPQRISRAPGTGPLPKSAHYRLPSSGNTPHRIHGDGREKRILITHIKRKEVVLLDEVLGESCFEKVMQTGIAVNVWKEEDQVRNQGGVMTGRSRMYMIQFRTSTEASWVFNMCGTYRYGSGAAV